MLCQRAATAELLDVYYVPFIGSHRNINGKRVYWKGFASIIYNPIELLTWRGTWRNLERHTGSNWVVWSGFVILGGICPDVMP